MANLKEGIENNSECKNSILDNEEQLINESDNDYNSSSDLKANYELFTSNCKSYEQLVGKTLEAKNIEEYMKNIVATRELIDQPLLNYCCKDLNQDFIKQFDLSSFDYTPEERASLIELFDEEKKKMDEAEKMDEGLVYEKKADVFDKLFDLFGILILVYIGALAIHLIYLAIRIYVETHDLHALLDPIPNAKIIVITTFFVLLILGSLSAVMYNLYKVYNRRYCKLISNKSLTMWRLVRNQEDVIAKFNTIFESKIEDFSSKMVDRIDKK